MANTYGYARESSADQNEARQIVALRNAGIEDAHIFIDYKSGKNSTVNTLHPTVIAFWLTMVVSSAFTCILLGRRYVSTRNC